MKLNKNGWGFIQMIWMSGIIVFFFLLAIILIYNFYRSTGSRLKSGDSIIIEKNHNQMLSDLNDAAYRYMEYYYGDRNDVNNLTLSSEKLFSAGLFAKDLYRDCTGYAIASKINGKTFSRSYIKCGDYKSPGYGKN